MEALKIDTLLFNNSPDVSKATGVIDIEKLMMLLNNKSVEKIDSEVLKGLTSDELTFIQKLSNDSDVDGAKNFADILFNESTQQKLENPLQGHKLIGPEHQNKDIKDELIKHVNGQKSQISKMEFGVEKFNSIDNKIIDNAFTKEQANNINVEPIEKSLESLLKTQDLRIGVTKKVDPNINLAKDPELIEKDLIKDINPKKLIDFLNTNNDKKINQNKALVGNTIEKKSTDGLAEVNKTSDYEFKSMFSVNKNVNNKNSAQKSAHKVYNKEKSLLDNKIINLTNDGILNKNIVKLDPGLRSSLHSSGEMEFLNSNQAGLMETAMPEAKIPMLSVVAGAKVLDMSTLKATDNTEIIDKITEYVNKSFIENRPKIDLLVKHDQLGDFKIHATKNMMTDSVEMKIITNSNNGHEFFMKNETSLSQALNNAGIELGGLKVFANSNSKNMDFDSRNFSNEEKNSTNKNASQNSNEKSSEQQDSNKRRELWEKFKERYNT